MGGRHPLRMKKTIALGEMCTVRCDNFLSDSIKRCSPSSDIGKGTDFRKIELACTLYVNRNARTNYETFQSFTIDQTLFIQIHSAL